MACCTFYKHVFLPSVLFLIGLISIVCGIAAFSYWPELGEGSSSKTNPGGQPWTGQGSSSEPAKGVHLTEPAEEFPKLPAAADAPLQVSGKC